MRASRRSLPESTTSFPASPAVYPRLSSSRRRGPHGLPVGLASVSRRGSMHSTESYRSRACRVGCARPAPTTARSCGRGFGRLSPRRFPLAAVRRTRRQRPISNAPSTSGSATTSNRGSVSGTTRATLFRSPHSAVRHRTACALGLSIPRRSIGGRGYASALTAALSAQLLGERPPVLLPLHRPRQSDLQQDLPRDRVRARVRLRRDRVRAHWCVNAGVL